MKILDLLVTTYLIAYFQLCVSNFFVSSPPEEKGQGMQKNLRTKSYVRRSTSQGAKLGGELRWIQRYSVDQVRCIRLVHNRLVRVPKCYGNRIRAVQFAEKG